MSPPPPSQISPPSLLSVPCTSNVFEIQKRPGGFDRGFPVIILLNYFCVHGFLNEARKTRSFTRSLPVVPRIFGLI